MTITSISIQDAKRMVLNCQGLVANGQFGTGKSGLLHAVEKLGYIQIDALAVVQRAHHHTLWSRTKNYLPKHLDSLITKERKLFEYWHHAMAYLPVRDFKFHLYTYETIRKKPYYWFPVSPKLKSYVLDKIKNEGPLFARDFKTTVAGSKKMWDIKPTKQALFELFMRGDIMVHCRVNFQRQYDLTERILPNHVNLVKPSEEDLAEFLIISSLKANGLMLSNEFYYLRNWIQPIVKKWLLRFEEAGKICRIQVGKGSESTYFGLPEFDQSIPKRIPKKVRFLSPFDNTIIQRKRVHALFNFSYQTEIYFPKHKRKYGYFAMPILYGTSLIGRIDPKADREKGILVIHLIQIEKHEKISDQLIFQLKAALKAFATFNECQTYSINTSDPEILKEVLV